MSGDAQSRACALIVICLLLFSSLGAQIGAPVAGDIEGIPFRDEDRLHSEYVHDGVSHVMDMKLSTNKVNDGSTLTVSVTYSSFLNGVSQVSGVTIDVYWGDVEVVSVSPAFSKELPDQMGGGVMMFGLSYGARAQTHGRRAVVRETWPGAGRRSVLRRRRAPTP